MCEKRTISVSRQGLLSMRGGEALPADGVGEEARVGAGVQDARPRVLEHHADVAAAWLEVAPQLYLVAEVLQRLARRFWDACLDVEATR